MKIFTLFFLLLSVLNAGSITIAVAANVSYAIEDLKNAFKIQHPEIKVQTILGSSGKLTAQITHGAPYGMLLSANMLYPQTLYKTHLAITPPKVYAQGQLAYLSNKNRDFTLGMNLLLNKNISKIAIANPKTAPYGKATKEALKNAKIYKKIKPKLIYGESIAQTLFFTTKAADIGIVAKSSLYSKHMQNFKENTQWKTVNRSLYTPINQGIVLLKYAEGNREYRLFYDFILSHKAKSIFEQYGYSVL